MYRLSFLVYVVVCVDFLVSFVFFVPPLFNYIWSASSSSVISSVAHWRGKFRFVPSLSQHDPNMTPTWPQQDSTISVKLNFSPSPPRWWVMYWNNTFLAFRPVGRENSYFLVLVDLSLAVGLFAYRWGENSSLTVGSPPWPRSPSVQNWPDMTQ